MVLVIVLCIGVIACVWLIDRAATNAITSEPAPSAWDARDGVGRCSSRTCTGVGTVTVVDSTDKPRRVCASCFERGIRLGWWASFATDRDLTHTEAREVHDDARRITGEAAGGGLA
jgi:hypothetical protein